MSEKNSYGAFKSHVQERGDRVDRIENAVGVGMFDVSCCFRPGVEFWLEIKSPTEPAKPGTPLLGARAHPVLQTQINWAKTQIQAGGLAFFFIDTDVRRLFIDAAYAEEINGYTANQLTAIAAWHAPTPTPGEAWTSLRDYIRGLASKSARSLTSIK